KPKIPVAKTVDEYLSRLPNDSHAALTKLRATIKSIVPDASEVISYGIPTFKYRGRNAGLLRRFYQSLQFLSRLVPDRSSSGRAKVLPIIQRHDSVSRKQTPARDAGEKACQSAARRE